MVLCALYHLCQVNFEHSPVRKIGRWDWSAERREIGKNEHSPVGKIGCWDWSAERFETMSTRQFERLTSETSEQRGQAVKRQTTQQSTISASVVRSALCSVKDAKISWALHCIGFSPCVSLVLKHSQAWKLIYNLESVSPAVGINVCPSCTHPRTTWILALYQNNYR